MKVKNRSRHLEKKKEEDLVRKYKLKSKKNLKKNKCQLIRYLKSNWKNIKVMKIKKENEESQLRTSNCKG